ncbi:MAG TPA: hypothetical protein VG097_07990 [Gemmata sp.]|nr:hypothetical protein [Gemmata sp.]
MTANPPTTELKPDDGWPDYPGFGDPDDVVARIHILQWIHEQIANGNVTVKIGDCILAIEGRILGVGEDPEKLHRRVFAANPTLKNARVVGYFVYSYDL